MVAYEGHIFKPPCLGKQVGEDFSPTLDAMRRLQEYGVEQKVLFSYMHGLVRYNNKIRVRSLKRPQRHLYHYTNRGLQLSMLDMVGFRGFKSELESESYPT